MLEMKILNALERHACVFTRYWKHFEAILKDFSGMEGRLVKK